MRYNLDQSWILKLQFGYKKKSIKINIIKTRQNHEFCAKYNITYQKLIIRREDNLLYLKHMK